MGYFYSVKMSQACIYEIDVSISLALILDLSRQEKEFLKMFQMPVIEVPTNLPNIRQDLPIQAFAVRKLLRVLFICQLLLLSNHRSSYT